MTVGYLVWHLMHILTRMNAKKTTQTIPSKATPVLQSRATVPSPCRRQEPAGGPREALSNNCLFQTGIPNEMWDLTSCVWPQGFQRQLLQFQVSVPVTPNISFHSLSAHRSLALFSARDCFGNVYQAAGVKFSSEAFPKSVSYLVPTCRAGWDHLCPTLSQKTTHVVTTCHDSVSSSLYPYHRNMMHNQKYLQSAPAVLHTQTKFCSPWSGKKGQHNQDSSKNSLGYPQVCTARWLCTGPDAHPVMGWVTMPGDTCN